MSFLSHNEEGQNILLKTHQRLITLHSNKVSKNPCMTVTSMFNGLLRFKVVQSF